MTCSEGEILTHTNGQWTCSPFNTVIDADGDGVLTWNDCDDNDPNIGNQTLDQDCDGIPSSDDCDDNDPNSNTTSTDADCDGALTNDDCDDNDSTAFDNNGLSASCAASSCLDILNNHPNSADGIFYIDPGGSSFEVYCDMTTDGGGWTMLLNLDTSDGHVMWWANELWTNTTTYGDVSTPFEQDHKSSAFTNLDGTTEALLVVHENGSYVGWKSFSKSGSGTLYEYLQGGDNTLLGNAVLNSDTANIWSQERLVRSSTSLYANHCVATGGGCTSGSSGSPDGDRIGSDEGTPSDNNGGGLGNWHDMHYCCSGQSYGGVSCNGSAFRTTSEAQAGWGYTSQAGTFGSDSYATMTNTQNDSGCSNSNWAQSNGVNYDYALFFR